MKSDESSPIQQTNHQHTSPCDAVWSGQHVLGRETFEDKENKVLSCCRFTVHFFRFYNFSFSRFLIFVYDLFCLAQLKSIVVVWALTLLGALARAWLSCLEDIRGRRAETFGLILCSCAKNWTVVDNQPTTKKRWFCSGDEARDMGWLREEAPGDEGS